MAASFAGTRADAQARCSVREAAGCRRGDKMNYEPDARVKGDARCSGTVEVMGMHLGTTFGVCQPGNVVEKEESIPRNPLGL